MFGDTPTGIIVLDFVLILMGMILSPLLWGIFSRLGNITQNLTTCIQSLTQTQETLTEVVKEQTEARVRDTSLEGRIKGIDDKLDRHIREEK